MTTTEVPAVVEHPPLEQKNSWSVLIGQIMCVLVPLAIWFSPLDLAPQTKHGFAILAFMVIAWITEATEFALAGFIGCFLFWALGVVKFDVAFSGFADATAWFLFAAMLIGLVASKSGLARRLAYTVMLRVGVTYPRILLGLIITDFLLTFIVPSGLARVVIIGVDRARADRGVPGAARQQHRPRHVSHPHLYRQHFRQDDHGRRRLDHRGRRDAEVRRRRGAVGVWLFAFLPCSIITVLAAWRLTLWLYPPEQSGLNRGREYFRERARQDGPVVGGARSRPRS